MRPRPRPRASPRIDSRRGAPRRWRRGSHRSDQRVSSLPHPSGVIPPQQQVLDPGLGGGFSVDHVPYSSHGEEWRHAEKSLTSRQGQIPAGPAPTPSPPTTRRIADAGLPPGREGLLVIRRVCMPVMRSSCVDMSDVDASPAASHARFLLLSRSGCAVVSRRVDAHRSHGQPGGSSGLAGLGAGAGRIRPAEGGGVDRGGRRRARSRRGFVRAGHDLRGGRSCRMARRHDPARRQSRIARRLAARSSQARRARWTRARSPPRRRT